MSARSPRRSGGARCQKWVELGARPRLPGVHLPEENVYQADATALKDKVILVPWRHAAVPVNVRRGRGALAGRSAGRGRRRAAIASPLDCEKIALDNRSPGGVFAAGFETTTAPTAAMLAEGIPDNLSILLSGA